VLTRTTKQGNVALLCMIDHFTLWPVVRAVKDLTAETTAKVFFQEICAVFKIPKGVLTDRGTSFTGVFFKTLMKLLNVHHRMSAARVSRTNGLTENLIQRVNQLIRCYCDDDTEIEQALPLIEMSLRSSVHTKMRISSYELVFGKHMNIGEPIRITDASNLQYTQKEYYDWLVNKLKLLHEGMRENRIEVKREDKVYYDKYRKAVPVSWKIGDKVGLFDPTVKPHSNQVLTKKYFKGPYFIVDIVQGNDDIGPAYRLADVNTGKTHRYLVT